jgi:hypothetical protein
MVNGTGAARCAGGGTGAGAGAGGVLEQASPRAAAASAAPG